MALVKGNGMGEVLTSEGTVVERDFLTMLADLAAPEAIVRRQAARELGDFKEAAEALCDQLEVEPSPSVRAVMFTSLIKLQSSKAVPRLMELLRSKDASLRNAAIEALQEMPDVMLPHINTLLDDSDSDIRIFAVEILTELRHEKRAKVADKSLAVGIPRKRVRRCDRCIGRSGGP